MSDWKIVQEPQNEWRIIPERHEEQTLTPEQGQNILAKMLQSGAKTGHGAFTGFDTAIQEMTHGVLQPLLESGYLGKALQQRSPEAAREREQRYQQAKSESPYATTLGYGGGKVAPDIAAAYLTGGGSLETQVPKYIKYLKQALGGGFGGALSGGAQYVNPGESRGYNALTGGVTGAALPLLGLGGHLGSQGIKSASKYIKHIPEALQPEVAAANIIKTRKAHQGISHEGYEALHEAVENSPLQKLNLPNIDTAIISKYADSKQMDSLKNFFERPDIDSAGQTIDIVKNIINKIKNKKSESVIHMPEHLVHKNKNISPVDDLINFKKEIERTLKPYKPNISLKSLKGTKDSSAAPEKNLKMLKQYLKVPTFRNAHESYKDLGKLIRNLRDTDKKSGLLGPDRNLLHNAINTRQKIKSQIFKNFEQEKDFSREFSRLNKYHKEEVLPYEHSLIEEYLSGRSTPSDFLKGLGAEKVARKQLLPRHPAIGVRKTLPYVGGAFGVYGVPKGLQYLFGGENKF